jgi:NADH-quinone oxidoreductase subunit J
MLELNAQSIAFFIFSVLALGGALGVVISRNLIHGALYLVVSLFGGAGFFVLLSAPFLAAVQVLVYIGAIAILIIFAVMLTRSMTQMRELFNQQWWLSANPNVPVSDEVATTEELGIALVDGNQYVLPFEVASLLLTAAMIGAIVIARDTDVSVDD